MLEVRGCHFSGLTQRDKKKSTVLSSLAMFPVILLSPRPVSDAFHPEGCGGTQGRQSLELLEMRNRTAWQLSGARCSGRPCGLPWPPDSSCPCPVKEKEAQREHCDPDSQKEEIGTQIQHPWDPAASSFWAQGPGLSSTGRLDTVSEVLRPYAWRAPLSWIRRGQQWPFLFLFFSKLFYFILNLF